MATEATPAVEPGSTSEAAEIAKHVAADTPAVASPAAAETNSKPDTSEAKPAAEARPVKADATPSKAAAKRLAQTISDAKSKPAAESNVADKKRAKAKEVVREGKEHTEAKATSAVAAEPSEAVRRKGTGKRRVDNNELVSSEPFVPILISPVAGAKPGAKFSAKPAAEKAEKATKPAQPQAKVGKDKKQTAQAQSQTADRHAGRHAAQPAPSSAAPDLRDVELARSQEHLARRDAEVRKLISQLDEARQLAADLRSERKAIIRSLEDKEAKIAVHAEACRVEIDQLAKRQSALEIRERDLEADNEALRAARTDAEEGVGGLTAALSEANVAAAAAAEKLAFAETRAAAAERGVAKAQKIASEKIEQCQKYHATSADAVRNFKSREKKMRQLEAENDRVLCLVRAASSSMGTAGRERIVAVVLLLGVVLGFLARWLLAR